MLIAPSGGPTAVINQSLVGAALKARRPQEIKGTDGALDGIKGILNEELPGLSQ